MAKCDCSNIAIMQVFHELKAEFPTVPDHAVLHYIAQYGHNKNTCRRVLSRAHRNYVMQSYPAASIAARRPPQQPPPAAPVCEPHMPGPPLQQSLPASLPPSQPSLLHPPAGGNAITPSKHWLVARLEKVYQQAGSDANRQAINHIGAPHQGRCLGGSLGFNPPIVHHGIYHGVQQDGSNEPDPTVDQYQVDVDCQVGRHRTALQLQPTPHFAADPARSYTSVNLTLRPPPPSGAPQPPPIDIQSAGSSLTYSSSSYDPRQGLQSQLQIRIGPAGQGSVSAMRTRVAPPANPAPVAAPPPDTQLAPVRPPTMDELLEQVRARGAEHLDARTKLLLLQQLERKVLLEAEVQRERSKLLAMQKEVQSMEEDLARRGLTVRAISAGPIDQSTCVAVVPGPKQEAAREIIEKTTRIREEIQILQDECKRMTQEVDRQAPESQRVPDDDEWIELFNTQNGLVPSKFENSVPLGETDQSIYLKMMRGHEGPRWGEPRTPQSPCSLQRPLQPTQRTRLPPTLEADAETAEDGRWTCHSCTFHNHELLENCEECEMPRLRLGTADTSRFNIPFQASYHEEPCLDLPACPQTDSATQPPAGQIPCYNVPVTLPSLRDS